ncbi:MAG: heme-copper oxidase subunit III [Planctomycetota bacterium]
MSNPAPLSLHLAGASHEDHSLRAKVGMGCFLVSEAVFFCTLIVAYITYLGIPMEGPTPDEVLDLKIPFAGTVFLLSSSLTIAGASMALSRGKGTVAAGWLAITAMLGVAFLVGTAIEWKELIQVHRLTIDRNLFGTTFFTLIGFHGAHVTMGVIIMSVMVWLLSSRRMHKGHAEGLELFSWYWHFVDVVWVAIFLIVYLVGRNA